MSITKNMPLNLYSSMKNVFGKIRIIFDIENRLRKSEIGTYDWISFIFLIKQSFINLFLKKQKIVDYFYESASKALYIINLKDTPSFCFLNAIHDNVTAISTLKWNPNRNQLQYWAFSFFSGNKVTFFCRSSYVRSLRLFYISSCVWMEKYDDKRS